jgi:hypothetical protein
MANLLKNNLFIFLRKNCSFMRYIENISILLVFIIHTLSAMAFKLVLYFCPNLVASCFSELASLYLNGPLFQTIVPAYLDVQISRFVISYKQAMNALSQTNVMPTYRFYDIANHRFQYLIGMDLMKKNIRSS